MIVEMRTYTFHPGGVPKFMQIYEARGMAIQKATLGNMIGYFTSEIGTLNQTVHMWGYQSLDDRQKRRAELVANADWHAFLGEVMPLLITQETKILLPTAFSPIR
jgi:hypothetical protein